MTKEKLKQEAEEYYFDRLDPKAIDSISEINDADTEDLIISAYLAGAEPREKQIQIDAEQIRALQKQNGELNDKVKKLEAEVKEWKDKADLWCKTANLKDHNIMINKELEKENAELKEELKDADEKLVHLACNQNKDLKRKNAELERIVKMVAMINKGIYTNEGIKAIYAEAEQFLKESE